MVLHLDSKYFLFITFPFFFSINISQTQTYLKVITDTSKISFQFFNEKKNLLSQVECNNDALICSLKIYYPSGNLKLKTQYIAGIQHGREEAFYENEQKSYQINYLMGMTEGKFIKYYKDGSIKEEGNYQDDLPTGYWKKYYENNKIKNEGLLVKGVPLGKWIYYHNNGSIQHVEFWKKDGYLYESSPYLTQDGRKLKNGNFSKGNGELFNYYKNGKIYSKAYYKNGHLYGKYYIYDTTGILTSEVTYHCDTLYGIWEKYYKNGIVNIRGTYEKKQGKFSIYHTNGMLKEEGFIKNNKKEGIWKYYYPDGTLKEKKKYLEGEEKIERLIAEKKCHFTPKRVYDDKEQKQHFSSGTIRIINIYQGDNIKNEVSIQNRNIKLKKKKKDFKDTEITVIGSYREGVAEGYWRYFYPSKIISAKGYIDDGVRVGNWIFYYFNGNIKTVGKYKYGERAGKWFFYKKNGKIDYYKQY